MRALIQQAPSGVFLAMVGILLAMTGVAVVAGLHARRQARIVSTARPAPIGMAGNGYQLLEGRVEAIGGETVVAPLTLSPCVWYRARVEEFTRRGKHDTDRGSWRTVRSITSSAPLLVRDSTGACVVHVAGAEVTPTDKSRWTGATLEPEDRRPPRVPPSGSTEGMLRVAGGPGSRFRYTEERIYVGDPLMVTGLFNNHPFDRGTAEDPDGKLSGPATGDAPEAPEHAGALHGAADDAVPTAGPGRHARHDWNAADDERQDALGRLARRVTRAGIRKGGRGQPLIVAASSADTHAAMSELGAQAAFLVALVPLGLAVLVLLARFG